MLAIVVRRLAEGTDREYELVLMLDPEIPEERREQIASEARTRIESQGELKGDTSWGMRKLAYEIRQRTEADYRLFRFETQGKLLDELNHNLRIADGVLRFRIFKVDPGSPAILPAAPPASSASAPARGPRRSSGGTARDEAEPAAEKASQPAAEADASGGESDQAAESPASSEAPGEEATEPAETDSEPQSAE
jgi:small subunit ribosomal protein S6